MTTVQQLIAEIEQELQDREGCNGALNSGAVLGLTNAKNIAHKYLEIEKEKIKDAYDSGIWDVGCKAPNFDEYYKRTFKSE
jgi:hypothetical protein